jgi:hypothetical protein
VPATARTSGLVPHVAAEQSQADLHGHQRDGESGEQLAARMAGAAEFIEELPAAYDTDAGGLLRRIASL